MTGNQQTTPSEPRYETKLVIVIALAVGAVLLLWIARGILAPVILGALLAFMLAPLVGWLDEQMPRPLAVGLSYLAVVTAAVALLVILPLAFFNALAEIDWIALFERIDEVSIAFLEWIRTVSLLGVTYDLSAVVDPLIETIERSTPVLATSPEDIGRFLASAVAATASVFGVVVTMVSFFVFTLLIAVSMSASGWRLVRGGLTIFPERHQPEIHVLGGRIKQVWADYVQGELVLVLAVGLLVTVVTAILGLPGAIFLGIAAGILELIPTFGPILAAIPAVLVALVSGSVRWDLPNLVFALVVVLAYIGIQMLENNLLGPKILGDAVRLHGLVVMIAITVGFQAAGVLGAILAVPIVASVRVLTRYAWWKVTGVDLATRAEVRTAEPPDGDVVESY